MTTDIESLRPAWLLDERKLSPRVVRDRLTQPVTFSTCVGIVPVYRMIWDTNGYYRELGVSPHATRREIREAYQQMRGWRSPRLTYIVKQLLDREVRAAYDKTPLGKVFFDYYVETMFRQQRVRESAWLRATGQIEEAEALEAEPVETILDNQDSADDDLWIDNTLDGSWPWAYYVWQTECADTERLQRWQEALLAVLGDREEVYEIAVGFKGWAVMSNDPVDVTTVGYRIVVFLRDDEQPTEALARVAASRVSQMA